MNEPGRYQSVKFFVYQNPSVDEQHSVQQIGFFQSNEIQYDVQPDNQVGEW